MEALNTDQFWANFSPLLQKLTDEVAGLQAESCTTGQISSLKEEIAKISSFATDAARFLPPYDVKRSQNNVESLKKLLASAELKFIPKKKFSFKDKKETSSASTTIPSTVNISKAIIQEDDVARVRTAVPDNCTVIENKEHTSITLTQDQLQRTQNSSEQLPQVLIRNCNHMQLDIACLLGSVRIEVCSNCTFVLGPIATSLYLESCDSSTLFGVSHQMRIHSSRGCSLYISCNSTPIIEDCQGMKFGPFCLDYDNFARDLAVMKLLL